MLVWREWFLRSRRSDGYTEEDFYELLAGQYVRNRSLRGIEAVYELLGRNLAGDYLHIVYRVLPDSRLRVFHLVRMNDAQKRRYQKRIRK